MTAGQDSAIRALDNLLDRERQALMTGQMSDVADMTTEKERLIAEVAAQHPADQAALDRLRDKLSRNGTLFEGAMAGMRAAGQRLAALTDPATTAGTYDAHGQKTDITPSAHRLEKRA